MNERIQELAEQARKYAEEKQNDPYRIYTLDCFNKKFAELIVRECLDIMQNCDGDLDFVIWKTKKNFGVEE